jgi:hypothetical protein
MLYATPAYCSQGQDGQNNMILNQAQEKMMESRDEVNRCIRLLPVKHDRVHFQITENIV